MSMLDKTRAKQGLVPAGLPAGQRAASDNSQGRGASIPPADGAATKPKKKPKRKPHPSSPATKDAKAGRLPDGAKFTVVYSAEAQRWSGTLEIPHARLLGELAVSGEVASAVFRGSASGVFRLLTKLDAEYRAFKATKPGDDAVAEFVAGPVEQPETGGSG